MLRKILVFIMLTLLCLSIFAVKSDDILGYWVTEDARSVVEVYKSGNEFEARIVALKEADYEKESTLGIPGTPRLDDQNPEKALQVRPILGLTIMTGFEFQKELWKNGKIYDPKNGKTYSCKMTLQKDGTLDVRGFIGVAALGRTTQWVRPDDYLKKNKLSSLGYEFPSPLLKK
ncbi:MAG: DUF2147 domain-containing protein [Candidatus Cloacimonetes bacterium]|nr:DUF2147 domain-containing protein [Candidatus Cloacimonadota bacterium]